MVILLALLACEPEIANAPRGDRFETLDTVRLLSRTSLDVRGLRPSADEIAAVQRDPAMLDVLREQFLQDPRFGERVEELFAERFLTRTDAFLIDVVAFDISSRSQGRLQRTAGSEPLKIVSRVAQEDLPITEIVQGDWTMADELLGRVFPLDYPADAEGWRVAHYTDGRPAAGVLATNGLWWRYDTNDSNANRKRANAVSRILLCSDYLSRPVDFDRNVDILDEEALQDSLNHDENCQSCHRTLDPLASYLYGFFWYAIGGAEVTEYHPARERLWASSTEVEPSYFGRGGDSLADLGAFIAADERFHACMVEHVAEGLYRREVLPDDADELDDATVRMIHSGYTLREVFRSLLDSPAYNAATDEDIAHAVPLKLATPALMSSQVEGLTEFRFTDGDDKDLMVADVDGFLTLAGGADGYNVTRTVETPSPTALLVHARLAEMAAEHVVEHDLAEPDPLLFDEVRFTETPESSRDAVVAQLVSLNERVLGKQLHADDPEITDQLELWSEVYLLEGDIPRTWQVVLSALLRDPDFVFY